MRCPKCGYISFDQQETCAKCSRNLQDISNDLKGTVVKGGEAFSLRSILEESEEQPLPAGGHGKGEDEGDIFAVEEFDTGEGSEPDEDGGVEIDFFLDEEGTDEGDKSLEQGTAEMAVGGDEVVVKEEETARPEEPDLKPQMESDIMEEEPDEDGLEGYDLENIDMSDLVIEDEGNEADQEESAEKNKDDASLEDLPDIEL